MVYILQMGDSDYYKIGYTSGEIDERIRQLQTGNPFKLKLVAEIDGNRSLEYKFHHSFRKYRKEGEWFIISSYDIKDIINGNIKRIHQDISVSISTLRDYLEDRNG